MISFLRSRIAKLGVVFGLAVAQGVERRELVPRAHGILLASSRKWLPLFITDPLMEPPVLLLEPRGFGSWEMSSTAYFSNVPFLCLGKARCMLNASQNFQSGCPPHFSLSDKFYPVARHSSRQWKPGIAFV